nr:LRR receptor-like serine/threonine-protein kinase EFR [Malus domestica]
MHSIDGRMKRAANRAIIFGSARHFGLVTSDLVDHQYYMCTYLVQLCYQFRIRSLHAQLKMMKVSVVRLVSILSLFNILFVCCFSSSVQMIPGGNETDKLALLAIKAQLKEDPNQFLSSWNESSHFCLWRGVTCSKRHRERVTGLDLSGQKLAGTISPRIGNLSFLMELYFQNNSLSGQIPPEFGRLRRFQDFFIISVIRRLFIVISSQAMCFRLWTGKNSAKLS